VSFPRTLLGSRVVAVEDLTRPWSIGVRTLLVTLGDGRRVVHQAGTATAAGRAGIDRRIRLTRALRAAAPGLPVPEVLDGVASTEHPWLVTAYITGVTGDAVLSTPGGAARLGAMAGGVATALAVVPRARIGRGGSGSWAAPGPLRAAAARWLHEAEDSLGPGHVEPAGAVVDRVPALFVVPPVLAHGDLAPVNLVVDGDRLAVLLDLERLRVAPVGFDAAWFGLLVRHHHPARWPDARLPLLTAAGLRDDRVTALALDDLAVLACLEMLAGLPRRAPAREAWAARAREILARG
jgi:aminoglycoside phosphotransferase (APT) family kinase protein